MGTDYLVILDWWLSQDRPVAPIWDIIRMMRFDADPQARALIEALDASAAG